MEKTSNFRVKALSSVWPLTSNHRAALETSFHILFFIHVFSTRPIQVLRNKLLRACCHHLVKNLLRADDIRFVGTTCCKSVSLINLVTDLSTTRAVRYLSVHITDQTIIIYYQLISGKFVDLTRSFSRDSHTANPGYSIPVDQSSAVTPLQILVFISNPLGRSDWPLINTLFVVAGW